MNGNHHENQELEHLAEIFLKHQVKQDSHCKIFVKSDFTVAFCFSSERLYLIKQYFFNLIIKTVFHNISVVNCQLNTIQKLIRISET